MTLDDAQTPTVFTLLLGREASELSVAPLVFPFLSTAPCFDAVLPVLRHFSLFSLGQGRTYLCRLSPRSSPFPSVVDAQP